LGDDVSVERKYIIGAVVAIALGLIVGKTIKNQRGTDEVDDGKPLAEATWTLPEAIDQAAGYLTRVNNDHGRFVYRMSADGKPVAPKKYNIVRHAGAIYALADYQVQGASADGRTKAEQTTERAAKELIGRYVRPLKAEPNLLAVWSDPKEEGGGKTAAKLGGAGLSIIGLMGRYRATQGDAGSADDMKVAEGLAGFIAFMQKPNGDYVSKYTDDDGKVTDFESLYYPGEATLGLTMLYEADRDPKWLDTAMKGIGYLVISRRDKKNLPADHWLMIAIDRLLPFFDQVKDPPITKDEMVEHAYALGKVMMAGQAQVTKSRKSIDGCYTSDGRVTPSATRLEGLLALEHALTGDEKRADKRKEVRASIIKGIAFERRAQITADGITKGAFPGSVLPSGDAGAEDDEEKSDEIRIDFVQHTMSAMMRYVKMCAADPTDCPK
jgi:hypothetical protein